MQPEIVFMFMFMPLSIWERGGLFWFALTNQQQMNIRPANIIIIIYIDLKHFVGVAPLQMVQQTQS